MDLKAGFYEQIINDAFAEGLVLVEQKGDLKAFIEPLEADESRSALVRYLAEATAHGLQVIREKYSEEIGLEKQVEACNAMIFQLAKIADESEMLEWCIDKNAHRILAILEKKENSISTLTREKIFSMRPVTPLSISTLFTGSAKEPSMINELKREIRTSDRIDMLVSFIKWSGLRMIMEELREFTQSHCLRVITTSYMGATDLKAIMELAQLPNTDIKVSYETRTTRLHAKSYMFYRETGFSTVYIGSSNLSSAAIGSGLEWNVKVTEKDMAHIIRNVSATFDTYWHDEDFIAFLPSDEIRLRTALNRDAIRGDQEFDAFSFRIEPYPFQKEILEKLDAERLIHGRMRNLVVSATGTGKTVVAAFDYKRFCRNHRGQPNRLLFVAHRQEILKQSQSAFRSILRDANFGELFVGDYQPERYDYLFISIQTFNSWTFQAATAPDYYDFIIVDEFHHAAAPSYQDLLSYYKPQILLGLTATPERMDGINIQDEYFDGVIAAEIRLPEAINRQLLVPFQYFGITDGVDLSSVRFERGRYEVGELEKVYTGNDVRLDAIVRALRKYSTDLNDITGLGFCVSVAHAQYMARRFNEHHIPALALHGESPKEERDTAKGRLLRGDIQFIFTVDLYNEGVDIPDVNTILFLRPTESMTIFLQQLGRGLRICDGKEVLTVFDFIGQANKKYSFEWKFRAMIGTSRHSVQHDLANNFPTLPRGCFIELERVAEEIVLENLRNNVVNKKYIMSRIRSFEQDTGLPISLYHFLKKYDSVTPHDIYKQGTFIDLCEQVGLKGRSNTHDDRANKSLSRLAHLNSRRLIRFLLDSLETGLPLLMSEEQLKMLNMFHFLYWQKLPKELGMDSAVAGFEIVRHNADLREEVIDLLKWCFEHIHFIDQSVDLGFVCPLDLHCAYSRDEILAATGYWNEQARPEMREGVLYYREQKVDLLFINLHKSEKDFSPTTMYEDYAINETHFHWQSQSTTSPSSITGQRYINHHKTGNLVLLFVRDFKKEDGQAAPYTYFGKANFMSTTGSKPMNIIWKLQDPMPANFVGKAVQAGVG